jgi:hypothetical protein
MTCRGVVKGKIIELETALPDFEGQSVDISVKPVRPDILPGAPALLLRAMDELKPSAEETEDDTAGSPALLLKALHAPPHVDPTIVDELERAIADARLPVRYEGIFDADAEQ